MAGKGVAARLGRGEIRRFVTFLFVGGLNTLVGYGIFAALILLGLPTPWAVIVGTVLGVLFNFVSTGSVVFKMQSGRLLPRFIGVYVVQMGLNIGGLHLLEEAGIPTLIAAALMLLPLAIFTYLALKRFVFNQGDDIRDGGC